MPDKEEIKEIVEEMIEKAEKEKRELDLAYREMEFDGQGL